MCPEGVMKPFCRKLPSWVMLVCLLACSSASVSIAAAAPPAAGLRTHTRPARRMMSNPMSGYRRMLGLAAKCEGGGSNVRTSNAYFERDTEVQAQGGARRRVSRRGLGLGSLSLGLQLAALRKANSEEEGAVAVSEPKTIYFDVAINEAPAGRIVVRLYEDANQGVDRFAELAQGLGAGLDYRRSLFTFVAPDKSFIKNAGVGSITGYSSKEIQLSGGSSNRQLLKELGKQTRTHDRPGLVSIIVRTAEPPPPSTKKLIAESGRLITIEEAPKGYVEPNGSEFVLTTQPAPYLDQTNLIVGEILEGMDVVEKIASLPTSKPKGKDDPFFKIGKSIGDPRAVFMSTRFGRPFARVQIVESGKL